MFLAAIMVPIEQQAENAKIKNLADSLWWAVTTITTVGYGDMVPVTIAGRMIAGFLQVTGVLLFGSIIGNFVLSLNHRRDSYKWEQVFSRFDTITEDLTQLKKKTDYLILLSSKHQAEEPKHEKKEIELEIKNSPASTDELNQDLDEILDSLRKISSF